MSLYGTMRTEVSGTNTQEKRRNTVGDHISNASTDGDPKASTSFSSSSPPVSTPAANKSPLPSEDIQLTAWCIAAKHLTAGQKDVTKMIADGIRHERERCIQLVQAALGPAANHLAEFVARPDSDW